MASLTDQLQDMLICLRNIFKSRPSGVITSFSSEFDKRVLEHVLLTPAPGRHAARSAIRHLERGWQLVHSMPELAFFSGITAEEESAVAVFQAIKRRNYKGSEKLRLRSHLHKPALHPFLLAVGKHMTVFQERHVPRMEFNTNLSPNGKEMLRLRINVPTNDGQEVGAYPLPPLEVTWKLNGELNRFETELSNLASEKNSKDILHYVEKLAKRRNDLLYAASTGIPHVEGGTKKFMKYRQSVVFSHLITYLLIDSHREKQLFVQQCLDAFMTMLGLVTKHEQEAIDG